MEFIERIAEVKSKKRELKKEVTALTKGLKHKDWTFLLNIEHKYPRFIAWKKQDKYNGGFRAIFVLKEDRLLLEDLGLYWDNLEEIKTVLSKWWSRNFSNELKME